MEVYTLNDNNTMQLKPVSNGILISKDFDLTKSYRQVDKVSEIINMPKIHANLL